MSSRRKMFLSRRLVTESELLDGGLLVSDSGIIEQVLTRTLAEKLLREEQNLEVVDSGDLALLAGVVDSHVHVNEPGRTRWEGFLSATAAAAAGGITTIVDMPLSTTTKSRNKVYVDVGFWGGVIPGNEGDLRDLVRAGVVGFKCFLCPSGVDEFPKVGRSDLEKAFTALKGTGTVLAFHAELECHQSKKETPCKDPEEYMSYLKSRPPEMELNAVALISSFLPETDIRGHIVHVSSASVVPLLQEMRALRAQHGWRGGLTAETCHHYLTLNAEDVPPGRSEYKCAPPIRDHKNKEKLWQYLLEDKLDLVVSDHSPCTPDLKCANNLEAWGGISSLQLKRLSLFWTNARVRGLGLQHISRYLSSAPASLCGLHHKGALKVGLDADIVFFDPAASFVVTPDIIRHKNKLTPYLGKELKGVVKKTFLRGRLIYSDGNLVGKPSGKLLLSHWFYNKIH